MRENFVFFHKLKYSGCENLDKLECGVISTSNCQFGRTARDMKNNPIIIGLVAACVSMAMMVAFSSMGLFVLIAVLLGPLPIYVAALGWGTRAALAAIIGVVVLTSFATDPANGAIIGMMIAAPAALAGHQANLAQSSQDGFSLHWYPLSRILFGVTLIIIVAIIAFGLLVDFDPTKLGPQIAKQLQPILPPGEGENAIVGAGIFHSTGIEFANIAVYFAISMDWNSCHQFFAGHAYHPAHGCACKTG